MDRIKAIYISSEPDSDGVAQARVSYRLFESHREGGGVFDKHR